LAANCSLKEKTKMSDATDLLLGSNLKQLRLPTIAAEFSKLAREAAEPTKTMNNTCCV
jgi:hypothetical protein